MVSGCGTDTSLSALVPPSLTNIDGVVGICVDVFGGDGVAFLVDIPVPRGRRWSRLLEAAGYPVGNRDLPMVSVVDVIHRTRHQGHDSVSGRTRESPQATIPEGTTAVTELGPCW